MKRIRVLLGEDAVSHREAIRAGLRIADDIEVAGEAESTDVLTSLVREITIDVVLVAQDLPPGDNLAAIRTMKQARAGVQIIVMTDRLDERTAPEAIKAGATGYVLKDIPGANLAAAIRSMARGQPRASGKLAERLSGLIRRHRWERGKTRGLTGRELDILREVARGRTDDEIAEQFVVTPGTVKTHIRHILRKISARNRAQAVAIVLRDGLIK